MRYLNENNSKYQKEHIPKRKVTIFFKLFSELLIKHKTQTRVNLTKIKMKLLLKGVKQYIHYSLTKMSINCRCYTGPKLHKSLIFIYIEFFLQLIFIEPQFIPSFLAKMIKCYYRNMIL